MGTVIPGIRDLHRSPTWFTLLLLMTLLVNPLLLCSAQPSLYQVNMRLSSTSPLLELRCPLYQAVPGDILVYSDMEGKELLRVILQENSPPPILALPIDSLNKDARNFVYVCRVLEPATNSLVSKTTFAVQKQVISNGKGENCTFTYMWLKGIKYSTRIYMFYLISVPVFETFNYDPDAVKITKAELGKPLKVECPLKGGSHVWFRAGGEMILSSETKERTPILNITAVKSSDLGTYFCAALTNGIDAEEDEEKPTGLVLPVQKFVVMAKHSKSSFTAFPGKSTNFSA